MASLETDSQAIHEVVKPVVDYINSFLTKLVPGTEVLMLLIVCVFVSYLLQHKYNLNKAAFIGFAVILFAGLRYLGVGG